MLETTLGYLEKGEEVLLLHRTKKKNDINEDKWIGIGGKLEAGETPLACMKRECLEETGLLWEDPRFRASIVFNFQKHPDDPVFSEIMYLYCGGHFCGTLRPCQEGDLVWMNWKDVGRLNLWKGDRIFLYYMRQPGAPFEMELNYLGDSLLSAFYNGHPVDLNDPRWSGQTV